MNDRELRERARALRTAGQTPKQIARTLGVPRATVTTLVRGVPVERPAEPTPTEHPLVGCWISRQWSNGLIIRDRPSDWIDDKELPPLAHGAGLSSVLVAREHDATTISFCGYLVDTYCLGAKNALPPSLVDRRDLAGYRDHYFQAASQLGAWEPPGRITFGLNGRPFFRQGPYDNAGRIMRTLDRTVGPGNYDLEVVEVGP